MRGILGLREHALVELQPAQLAVDVERGVLEIRWIDRAGRDGLEGCASRGLSGGAPVSLVPAIDGQGISGRTHDDDGIWEH